MSASAWKLLSGLPAYRVVEVPRPTTRDERDTYRELRVATLVSAYHARSGPVAVGWFRAGHDGPIEVYVGGAFTAGSGAATSDDVVLSLPAGAVGRRVPDGLADIVDAVGSWSRVLPVHDGLLLDRADEPVPQRLNPSLEECLLGVWRGPFAWLVLVDPVPVDDIEELVAVTADRARTSRAKAESSPDHAVNARRLDARHRELSSAASIGLWRTHVFAGSSTSSGARGVAGLVCASTDLAGEAYLLTPDETTGPADVIMDSCPDVDLNTGTRLVAGIARTPVAEIPGVRFTLRPEFDVTPELDRDSTAPVAAGVVLDRNGRPAGTLDLSRSSLNRHTFVCGATGSGKSQTVRGLLESATRVGLPWLVVEPAKAEYRLMAARLAGTGHDVVVIRPGSVDAPPAGINPLEPAIAPDGTRFPLQTHADLVRALFLAAFDADEPFPQVLSAALTSAYEELGWDLVLGEPVNPAVRPRYPTLTDLEQAAERVVERIGYGREVTDNVRGFVRVRLAGLRGGTTGRFLEAGHPIDFDALLRRNVVFEIEDVGDDRDKAFLMGTVLIRLVEHLRLRSRQHAGPAVPLRHLSVFEEAHRLLRRSEAGPAAHAVEMFAGLLAEIRAYGEGLVIADQIPEKLTPEVIKNTAIKIVHRLPALDDREAVGATMNITEAQSEYLVTLRPGHAAVFTDGMDYPVLVAMPDGSGRESAAPPVPVPADALLTPRSSSCSRDCAVAPCTLRMIRAAQRGLERHPGLVMWAELAVLAHLTGWSTPMPRGELLAAIRSLPARERDCALSHAVDRAVAVRGTTFAARLAPTELAVHVIEVMRQYLTTGATHAVEEPQWLAPAYRWCLLWSDLHDADRADPSAGRHPRSEEWTAAYGEAVPGGTTREQLEVVKRRFDRDQRAAGPPAALAFGSHTQPPLVSAVGVDRDHPEWATRLAEQLADFGSPRWPLRYLAPGRKGKRT